MSDILDMDSLSELKALMGDKFPKLVETYTRNADKHVANIQNGFANDDAQGIVDAAHPLKSASGNMGLLSLSRLAESIEHGGKTVADGGAELSSLQGDVEAIGPLYEQGKAALLEQV